MTKITKAEENPAEVGSPQGLPQRFVRWKSKIARVTISAGLCLVVTGCAASNYNFDVDPGASDFSRAQLLGQALVQKEADGAGDDLHRMSMAPLLHTQLQVFARANEPGIPKGFVETEIDSYLPLFGFIDLTVNRYDENYEMYESHEYDSYLWGLFQTHKEQIATPVGLREKKTRRLFWFVGWRASPEYSEVTP